MAKYKNFISENIAILGTRRIGVYDSNGNRVGVIPLESLAPPDVSEKMYSFGAISDVHVTYTTGEADLMNTLKYFNAQTDVEFLCISGDLATTGVDSDLLKYKNIVDAYAQNLPIYVSAGNHDAYGGDWVLRKDTIVSTSMQTYTGNPLYYSFERGDDVFIFVGVCDGTFSATELQWLYETLEKYRNKRCFLFQHIFAFEGCGNVFGLYSLNLTNNTMYSVFKNLLRHYSNIIWFHGHSHTKFHGQEFGAMANYDNVFGCHSVHIPSNAIPRTDADGDNVFQIEYQDSEGYIVDVYPDGIHLRGRDFVTGEFLPIASYWLDTKIKTIEANTFVDETGVIKGAEWTDEQDGMISVVPYTDLDGTHTTGAGGYLYKNHKIAALTVDDSGIATINPKNLCNGLVEGGIRFSLKCSDLTGLVIQKNKKFSGG